MNLLRDVVLILCLCSVMYLYGLGVLDLKQEEPRRALVAREMLDTGHWMVPHLNGQPYLAKPPVFYWLIAAASLLFGDVTETAARLPSVLSVLGIALLVYGIGTRHRNQRTGLSAACMVLTSALFLEKGTMAEIDMNFALWVAGFLCAMFHASKTKKPTYWALSYLLLALAFLVKGPPALLFFVAGIVALTWMYGPREILLRWRNHAGVVLFLAPVGIWLWAVHTEVGIDTLMGTARVELVDRAAQSSLFNPLTWLYYPLHVAGGFLPWTLLLIPGLIEFRKNARSDRGSLIVYGFIVTGITMFIFSFSAGKAARYMIPVLPLLALATAELLDQFRQTEGSLRRDRFMRTSLILILVLAPIAVLAVAILAYSTWDASIMLTVGISLTGIAIAVLSLWSIRARSFSAALLVVVIAVGIYRIAYVSAYAPERNQRKSITETLTPMQEVIQEGDRVYTLLAPRNYRLLYYLNVPVLRIDSVENMVAEIGERERVHVLVMEEGRNTLEGLQPGRWNVAVSFPNKDGTGFLMSTVSKIEDN